MAPSAPLLDPSPRCIGGRFELLEPIGEGACASVWLARHQDTGAFYAAKLVEVERGQDTLRFQREAELSARLTHRNLVRVFDYVREDRGQAALLMEHLRGETVEDVLRRRGPLAPLAAVALIVSVLRGLEHAHAEGIVHRDLKPSNIFLAAEPDGVVIPKILDFGIAKATEDERAILLTQQGHVLGTPAYMSPEQVRGEQVGATSDLFSLGVVLYELLTGTLVFRAPSPHAAMLAILQRKVEPHASIPADLWAVLERALAKSAADRWPSASAMRDALEACACYAGHDAEAALRDLDLQIPPLPSVSARSSTPSYPPLEVSAPTLPRLEATTQSIPGLPRAPRAALWGIAIAACALTLLGTSVLGRGVTLAAATQPDALTLLTRLPPAPPSALLVESAPPAPSAGVAKSPGKTAAQKALAAKLGPPPPTDARPTPSPSTKAHKHR